MSTDYLGTDDTTTEVEAIGAETEAWMYWWDAQEAVKICKCATPQQTAAVWLAQYLAECQEGTERSRTVKDEASKYGITDGQLGQARRGLMIQLRWIERNTTTVWTLPSLFSGMPSDIIPEESAS
jgi:hypothetical protein